MNNVLLATKQNKNSIDIDDLKTKHLHVTDYITNLVNRFDILDNKVNILTDTNTNTNSLLHTLPNTLLDNNDDYYPSFVFEYTPDTERKEFV